jgi:myo-inositol-1(or 4)-monophosphatase
LDGTVNYVFGLPFWSVSVALVDAATRAPLVGVVHAPEIGMTMAAAVGHGAQRVFPEGPAPLEVSTAQDLSQALVATGFGYDAARRSGQARVLGRVLPQVRDLRRMGSCAIDMCYVAAGSLDGYFERGVHEWDFAAGALIVTEAGGVVSGLWGGKPGPEMVVAAGAALHGQLTAILEQAGAGHDQPTDVAKGEP